MRFFIQIYFWEIKKKGKGKKKSILVCVDLMGLRFPFLNYHIYICVYVCERECVLGGCRKREKRERREREKREEKL